MNPLKDFDDNLDVFKKLVQYIVNFEESVFETYNAIILFNSIPDIYMEVKKVQLSMVGTF